jgi:hypothetical protein
LLAISAKLSLRNVKAVATPSGLLYTDENTLAASCFRIPEEPLIDFSRYLIREGRIKNLSAIKLLILLKPEITFKNAFLPHKDHRESITKTNWLMLFKEEYGCSL